MDGQIVIRRAKKKKEKEKTQNGKNVDLRGYQWPWYLKKKKVLQSYQKTKKTTKKRQTCTYISVTNPLKVHRVFFQRQVPVKLKYN